ncbi:MAG: hypothetical protein A2X56_12175 [Nitrospirae bacterium GWC2_57_13]|nr:MAG: hypothetical protein A2X56_12175 [Nitrospirae bacterium GWC2_57_13]HAS53635.1 hypothetical protein [Nitrospiraceae bacterium]
MEAALKLSAFFLSIMCLSLATVCLAETDHEKALIGTWEYRQAAGESFDNEGEILQIARNNGLLHCVYFGLEREGDHGLFYTAVKIKDLTVKSNGEVSFTVPERDLFTKRPKNVQEAGHDKLRSAGFTRNELQMRGHLQGDRLTLHCTSKSNSCPDGVMVFLKGKWSPR